MENGTFSCSPAVAPVVEIGHCRLAEPLSLSCLNIQAPLPARERKVMHAASDFRQDIERLVSNLLAWMRAGLYEIG